MKSEHSCPNSCTACSLVFKVMDIFLFILLIYFFYLFIYLVICLYICPLSFHFFIYIYIFYPVFVGPCHHGMARPQVADGGTASGMEGSCEQTE